MGSVDFSKDFPYIVTHKRVDWIMNHPSFTHAKNGDLDHALVLVKDLINKDKIELIKSKYSNAIIAPVHAKEEGRINLIPIVYAKVIGKLSGLEVDTEIFQSNHIGRTNKSAIERLLTRAKFDGEVKRGQSYIIVDDVATQGGTLSELRSYIEKNGGHVVLASTLGYTQFSTILAIKQNNIEELERRFGRNETEKFLKEYGVAERIEQLTNGEARHILSYKGLDRIRERANEIRIKEATQELRSDDGERPILREVSITYERDKKMQKDIDKERFAEVFSKIFDVKKDDVMEFINKDVNGIKNLFYHPTSFSNDYNFVNKILEFKELNSIFKNMGEYNYKIFNSDEASKYMQNLLGQYKDKEKFTCVFLDNQNNVIAHKIFDGSIDQAPVYPREIIKLALNYDAKSVLIGHNHPGGSICPSKADQECTTHLVTALKTVDINVIDHIIVGGGNQYSFVENSVMSLSEESAQYKISDKKYKFDDKEYSMNEIKNMYKTYGKSLEKNYDKDDYEKFNELKKVIDDNNRQNLVSLKKDPTEKVKNLSREI